ncbi:MCE family protein [soil metagenome]
MTGRRMGAILAVITVVVATVGGGWWYFGAKPAPFTVTAQFDDASGLYEGNVVAVLGMPVGKITRITPRGGYVEVDFTVDRNVKIPVDAQAVTVSTSILTDRQIELTPPYRGGPTMQNHDTIGLTRTKTPVEFSRVLSVLDRVTKSLGGDGQGGGPLAEVINNSAAVVDGNGGKIRQALDELSQALRLSSDGGVQTREQITTIVTNVSSLLDAAATNDAKLREFASTLHVASQILADEDIGTGSTGKRLNQLVQQASDLLDARRDEIKQSILNGNTLAKTATENQREMAELLDLSPMVADNIYNSIDQTNGAIRGHALVDKIIFDSQWTKEVCNMMGLRQLGCSTGTLQDFGPDFGLTYVLDGMAAMGQK